MNKLAIIIKREDYLEIMIVDDGIEILKRAISWDLNQVKELL